MFAFQVKEVALAARKRNARLSFAFVYPDKNGRFVVRQVRVYSHCNHLAITNSSLQFTNAKQFSYCTGYVDQ